ncbi:MAG: type I methionyl aminopeptidase [Alphaproteobacteria bacterium]|nr:type I methionyl aminopeptidase [Alphaproteobacteria bacterium]
MNHIVEPEENLSNTDHIMLHGDEGFAAMRKAGRLAAEALDLMETQVTPGVTTAYLDKLIFEFATNHGAIPATINYRGYKHSICTSVNHVVCHGIPDKKKLREGDIINIDVTLIVDGWHGDTSRMYPVGKIKPAASRLIEATYQSMMRGIEVIRPGATTNDIGTAIQNHAESLRTSVVRDFCGHGLGRFFHEPPTILHYAHPHGSVPLKKGMFFTVEPMLNLGRPDVKISSDGWTAVTRDRSLSAQFEHTLGVTETGVEIFTLSPSGFDSPSQS